MKYRDGYKYQLAEDIVFQVSIHVSGKIETQFITLTPTGLLRIKSGYAWDGPSGPTIDTKNFMRGSLAHDALYQLMRMELLPQSYRLSCDAELDRICKLDGMSRFRRWYIRRELRKFGGAAADPKNKKPILLAP